MQSPLFSCPLGRLLHLPPLTEQHHDRDTISPKRHATNCFADLLLAVIEALMMRSN